MMFIIKFIIFVVEVIKVIEVIVYHLAWPCRISFTCTPGQSLLLFLSLDTVDRFALATITYRHESHCR